MFPAGDERMLLYDLFNDNLTPVKLDRIMAQFARADSAD
jgi:hypothetical protein